MIVMIAVKQFATVLIDSIAIYVKYRCQNRQEKALNKSQMCFKINIFLSRPQKKWIISFGFYHLTISRNRCLLGENGFSTITATKINRIV